MSALQVKDGTGATVYLKETGGGASSVDPFIPSVIVDSGTIIANIGTVNGLVTDANLDEKFGDLGQKAMAGSAPVVIASDQSAVPVSGAFYQATQPVSAAALPLPAGASTAAKQPALGTAGVASTDVITIQGIASGTPVTVGLAAGSNLAGKFGIDQTSPGTTNAVAPQVAASGGATPFHLQSGASTNATSVKASAGQLYSVQLTNTSTTNVAFVKFHDIATSPTPGTTAVKKVFTLPSAVSATQPTVVVHAMPLGVSFGSGIGLSITGGSADADTTAVAAGQVIADLDYK